MFGPPVPDGYYQKHNQNEGEKNKRLKIYLFQDEEEKISARSSFTSAIVMIPFSIDRCIWAKTIHDQRA